MTTGLRQAIHLCRAGPGRQRPAVEEGRRLTGSCMPRGARERDPGSSAPALQAHDVFVSDAHEHIVPIPEDRPAILLLDVGGLNLTLVLELVAANVDAIRVQLELLLIFLLYGKRTGSSGNAGAPCVGPAESGLHRSTSLRSEVLGGDDQGLEHLQGR